MDSKVICSNFQNHVQYNKSILYQEEKNIWDFINIYLPQENVFQETLGMDGQPSSLGTAR